MIKTKKQFQKPYLEKLKFIDSVKLLLMASSLSNLVIHKTDGIHKTKCKYQHHNKKCETCWIKDKGCKCCFEYKKVQDDLLVYQYLCCNRKLQKKIGNNLEKSFANTYNFSRYDINIFIYPYEYMND